MREGEKVCIQVITPMQFRELLASRHSRSIDSLVVTTGLATILAGMTDDLERASLMAAECCSHGFQRIRPIEMLAPGDKPSFQAGKINHFSASTTSARFRGPHQSEIIRT